LPVSLAQYFATAGDTSYQQLLDQVRHPGAHPPASAVPFSGWLIGFFALAILLTPYATVAVAAAAGMMYRGTAVDWRAAYAVAVRHWGAVLMTVVCEIALLVLVVFAGAMGLGIGFAVAFLLLRTAPAAAVVVFVIATIFTLAYFLFIVLFYLAFAFAFNAIGIEQIPFTTAIARGFERIFNRTELGKAAVIALALIAVYIGLFVVSTAIAGILTGIVHLTALNSIVQGVVTLISTAFLGLLIAVYYFDVRVRREGLDMQADIEQLATPAQA
jgi:hypothetical protein